MPWKKRPGFAPVNRKTIEIDAGTLPVGRLATRIAMILMGKHKADYEPHKDTGDKVLVTNIGNVYYTGRKMEQKKFYRTSNRPGGLKAKPVKELKEEAPEQILIHAVKYMLPKNKLQALRMKRLTFKK
ncbi:MAG: 50S ribosomal protein L13 [Candidatus Portnoybacteria bacterium]|nr:50S ribosomal protein L13 [Candidatus Portnoybacteria bacterium]MDD5437817.1 50S ribosomal protein L13 [Patescibacteria group bacterium]